MSRQELTMEKVEALDDLFSATTLCMDLDIDYGKLETLDELKLLLRANIQDAVMNETLPPHQSIEQTLDEDSRRLTRLTSLYEDIARFLSSSDIEGSMREELEHYSPGYMAKLKKNLSDLMQHECPIVVAGETSAGKSTIINILLGQTLLPEMVLHATSCICHIKNGENKSATLVGFDIHDNKPLTIDLSIEENIKELEKLVRLSSKPNCEIFITWPIPILRGHVSLVDTPGIGDPEMTTKVMEFIPRAAAFIYVVNAGNAGGVHKDKLIKVVKRQCSHTGITDHLQIFDPSSAIFVLNKWDTVPHNETEEVVERIYDRLRRVWHGLTREQLYRLCATKAARCLKYGAGKTKKFAHLWKGIEQLIPVSLELNSRAYFDWLWMILKTTQKIIYMRVSNAKENQKEKRDKETNLRERLSVLQDDADVVMEELSNVLTTKSDEIVDQLYDYLRHGDIVTRLSTWDEAELPYGNDMDIITYQAEELIKERIVSEFMEWRDKSNVFDNILREICQMFKNKFKILDDEFSKWEKELDFCTQNDAPDVGIDDGYISYKKKGLFGTTERVVLGLTLPLWAPLALVASFVVIPVIGTLALKESIRQKTLFSRYKENRHVHMSQWTIQVIDKLTKPVIKASIVDRHMQSLWDKLRLLKQVIPRQLEADNQLIINVLNDARSSSSILKLYTPLQRSCRALVAKCRLLRLEHYDPDKITLNQLTIGKKIDGGTYADVFGGEYVTRAGVQHRVAVKIMREQDRDQDARRVQSAEVDILRNLQHENVVKLHGVVCEELPLPCFYIIMELCVGTLKDATFRLPGRVAGNHPTSSANGKVAFCYFLEMMKQVLIGLDFIHNKGYVHRDIKLSNILLTADNTVKISDVGMSAYEDDITSTLCGTWSHVAPEVIQGRNYRQPADIYSLGIMMWELWYGRSAYSDETDMYEQFEPMQLLMAVVEGVRPSFRKRERPSNILMKLITNCWKDLPADRPTSVTCLQILNAL